MTMIIIIKSMTMTMIIIVVSGALENCQQDMSVVSNLVELSALLNFSYQTSLSRRTS